MNLTEWIESVEKLAFKQRWRLERKLDMVIEDGVIGFAKLRMYLNDRFSYTFVRAATKQDKGPFIGVASCDSTKINEYEHKVTCYLPSTVAVFYADGEIRSGEAVEIKP